MTVDAIDLRDKTARMLGEDRRAVPPIEGSVAPSVRVPANGQGALAFGRAGNPLDRGGRTVRSGSLCGVFDAAHPASFQEPGKIGGDANCVGV